MKNIVLFASGSGSNVENIITYFKKSLNIKVAHVYTNNPKAGVLERCERLKVPCTVFAKEEFNNGTTLEEIKLLQPELLVLAGFLLLVPSKFIEEFPNQIINIHPSLLPDYGGKGMYGSHVHKAVIANKEPITGITIHYVNEQFDKGEVILQSSFEIKEYSLEFVEKQIHELEHHWFPIVIERLLLS